jgi:ornithine cyclodeaminase/alanine dehydrogenase-like protein (mu-crystallin family)
MAVTLGFEALQGVLGMGDAIDLLERAFAHEAAGRAHLSPKFVSDFEGGSMRMLFAADYAAGYCAVKAYHSITGRGVRYLVSLYRLQDGELLALLDGRTITDLRTGAASGVMARKVAVPEPVTVGLIGSGHQARAQLESLASVYQVARAAVYSPTAGNRENFAREMTAKLGFPVEAVGSAEIAVRGHPVVVAASSARDSKPVLRGEWLDRCRLLCAVGNTRRQFAEVDVRCFRDARLVVVDTPHALDEAGELRQAIEAGALPEAKRATLGQIITGARGVPAEGLIAFKSVGTALQDLALAVRYYELAGARAGVPTAADLASIR